jgi:hypothetical protein
MKRITIVSVDISSAFDNSFIGVETFRGILDMLIVQPFFCKLV